MSTAISFVIFALTMSIVLGSSLICDDHTDLTTGVCGQLSKDVERALLKDEGNLFRIRRAFFHSPTASPVLLKVVYNVTYGENLTMAVEEIPFCFSQILQNSTIDLSKTDITLGWTSSGVYTMFHPTVLSVMQVQSPFAFLRIIHLTLIDQRGPEAESFLWDGSYNLPTLHLNLHITSLTCVPSQAMFESVLMDLNTLLKLYGGLQEMISVTEHPEYIGFTLPTTSVSSKVIPIGSDVIFVNLYSFTLCLLYAISICLLTVWYYLPSSAAKETIDALINQNAELSMGIRITSSTALALEFITRLATCIVWTLNIENPLGILLAVWMPQIHLFIMAAVQIVFVTTYICYHSEGGYQVGSALRTFSNLCATTFTLFYLLFPTIILMFAYPTQIIVIFTFVTAYLFATTIFSASIVKLYNKFNPPKEDDHGQQTKKDFNEHENTDKEEPQKKTCCTCDFKSCRSKISEAWHDFKNDWKNIVKEKLKKFLKKLLVLIFFITLWLIIIYLHFLVVFASYSMLIGRGSVINTGPLFLISLLPSAVLSGGAWIAKRVALKGPEQTTESEGEEKIANKEHTQSKENGISNGTESAHQTLEMEAVSPINDMSQISHANGNGIQSQDTKI